MPCKVTLEARVQAVSSKSTALREMLSELLEVVAGYEALAASQFPKQTNLASAQFTLASLCSSFPRQLKGKPRVCVLSAPPPVRPDGQYVDQPHVAHVSPHVKFVGGVNAPKRITVTDTAGQVRCLAH